MHKYSSFGLIILTCIYNMLGVIFMFGADLFAKHRFVCKSRLSVGYATD